MTTVSVPAETAGSLYNVAVEVLRNNSRSPYAAVDAFVSAIVKGGGIGAALIGWNGATKQVNDLCLAYLRDVLQSISNETVSHATGLAPMKQRSKPAPGYKTPTASEIESEKRVRRLTRPPIFDKILIGGMPIGSLTVGEAKSIFAFNVKVIGDKSKENFILERVLAFGKPPSDTMELGDFIPEKNLIAIDREWETANA